MEHSLFEQLLLILVAAVVSTTLFRRIHLPPILAYLTIGALVGPFALGYADPHEMHLMSELGVVFLLFMLGLEFSLPKMIAMRHTVLGVGSMQVVLTTLILVGVGMTLGLSLSTAIVIAGALALSSTAIVTRELMRLGQLSEKHGQLAFGILLFQDIAAVAFLILVPSLAETSGEAAMPLWLALLQGAGLLLLLMLLGRTLLPALFHEIGHARSEELFVLVALVTALAAAWLTHAAGLSMALGGFLAGMMLGESHFKHQLESDIRPFRDVLLGLFFVTVGMQLNIWAVLENWHWVLLMTVALMSAKSLLITLIAGRMRGDYPAALRAGLALAQGSEFGFALLALALSYNLVDSEINALVISTIIFSMVLTPILINFNRQIADRLFNHRAIEETTDDLPDAASAAGDLDELSNHVIVCGFGRVGQIVCRFLGRNSIRYVAIDQDPVRIREAAHAGEPAYYGNANRADLLRALGADRARLLILTLPDEKESLRALQTIKREYPKLQVLVRTQDDNQLNRFQEAGAAEVVPEALEGSLMLVSHVLSQLGVPAEQVGDSIRQAREGGYQLLHGFLHGGKSAKLSDSGAALIQRSAITLSENAYACNRRLDEIDLGVEICLLRRDGQEFELPDTEIELKQGDTLIVSGSPPAIEAAEEALLIG